MQLTTEELCARAASPRHGEASQSAEKESEKVEFQSDASNASETTLPSPGGANKHRISAGTRTWSGRSRSSLGWRLNEHIDLDFEKPQQHF
jgi:hypothetical protein